MKGGRRIQRRRWMLVASLGCLLLACLVAPVRHVHAACKSPMGVMELQTGLEEVSRAYASVDYEQAYTLLNTLEGRLVCGADVFSAALLHRLFQLEGVVALATGAEAQATQRFEQAYAIAPSLGWDNDLGSKGEALWNSVRTRRTKAPQASVALEGVPKGLEVAVNGVRLKAGNVRILPGGYHLVQVQTDGPTWSLQHIQIPAGVAWRLAWVGDEVVTVPRVQPFRVSTVVGASLTAALGVTAAISGGIYIPIYQDCLDGCDLAIEERGLRARDIFIPALSGAILSAGFTWLLPQLDARLTRTYVSRAGIDLPSVALQVHQDPEGLLMAGVQLGWRR